MSTKRYKYIYSSEERCYDLEMGMELIKKVRDITGLTNYGIAKALNKNGVEITISGVGAYEKPSARSMRIDVLLGLWALMKPHGTTATKFMAMLEDEFKKELD